MFLNGAMGRRVDILKKNIPKSAIFFYFLFLKPFNIEIFLKTILKKNYSMNYMTNLKNLVDKYNS